MASKKKKSKSSSTAKAPVSAEWIGGLVEISTSIESEDGGERYSPELLVWSADGKILGMEMGKPGELLGVAVANLRQVIENAAAAHMPAPTTVRVESVDLANELLRALDDEVRIVCAPTPEIDDILLGLRDHLDAANVAAPTYLSGNVRPEHVAPFFTAAAELYRAEPWKIVPDDEGAFAVTIPQLNLSDAVLCVVGQHGEASGFLLFSRIEHFEAFAEAGAAAERGEHFAPPPHLGLAFERRAMVDAKMLDEIVTHRWETAGVSAYPVLLAMREDGTAGGPTVDELARAEAIARVLPKVLKEKKAVVAAWKGGDAFTRSLSVTTHGGDIEVALRTPHPDLAPGGRPTTGLLAELWNLTEGGDESSEGDARRDELEDALLAQFAASAEAEGLRAVGAPRLVMDVAATAFGESIASIGARELREILYQIIPEQADVVASDASAMVDELRAFYAFLGREYGLAQAAACLRLFGEDAATKLERALSDETLFGKAKAIVVAGRAAGFDMSSKEGVEAWMQVARAARVAAEKTGTAEQARPRAASSAKTRKTTRKARTKKRG